MRANREGTKRFLRSGLLWAILAFLIVAFIWFVPQLQGEYFSQKVPAEERPALINEYRRTWAQIIGGFGLLLGLYFTWRRIEISRQELEATRDQQVTERFTRAIDQLGATDDKQNKRIEIRLGGIYALERIAWDSFAMENSPGRDYSTVMEVLAAYVRENTRPTPRLSRGSSGEASTATSFDVEAEQPEGNPTPTESHRPTADIQAILDVLRRTQVRVPKEYHTGLDLHEANLQNAYLFEADLQQANLHGANLHGAELRIANLLGANLRESNLQEAYLLGAYLLGADLLGADLQGADLSGANLHGADLRQADLQGANLHGAKVTDEQLADTFSLRGATMPDGSKHP